MGWGINDLKKIIDPHNLVTNPFTEVKKPEDLAKWLADPHNLVEQVADLDPMKKTYAETQQAEREEEEKRQEAADLFDTLTVPEYENYDSIDPLSLKTLTPKELKTLTVYNPYDNVEADSKYVTAQDEGIEGVRDIINSGGLTETDMANLNRIQSEVGRADRGRREAIQQTMQQRGMGGSGMNLLAQLQSGQAATDRANQTGLDVAAMGQQRREQALRDLNAMGLQGRQQSFGEGMSKAEGTDSVNRFNSDNRKWGLGTNLNISNQESLYNKDFEQAQVDAANNAKGSEFGDQRAVVGGKANILSGQADSYQQKAQQSRDKVGQFYGAMPGLAATLYTGGGG